MISLETFPCARVECIAGASRARPFFRCGQVSHLAACVVLGQALLAGTAQAGPSGGQVVGGSGAIDYGDGLTKIEQHSSRLAIDWQSFDLDTNEKVRFLQPDASSIALNRILGSSASTIRGAIEANGHVLLVNPRGILFTETAKIEVGGLVASGLDLDPRDFLRGNDRFSALEGEAGFVVNRGLIEAARGVALLGNSVANESTGSLISANLVSMNAASEAVLTFDADNMIGVRVTREVLANQLGVDDAVLNSGSIEAGTVLLNADTSSELFSNAVNNSGVVRAAKIDTSGGVIRLTGTGSDVINTGELDASGAGRGGEIHLEGDRTLVDGEVLADSSTGAGGKISVLGDKVGLLNNAFVSASGASGGGEVLIGGDYLGGDAGGRNAQVTYFAPDAEIFAKAFENGDGGKVIVWADDITRFYGSIDANAGSGGGDGGFVETSGKFYVDLQGSVTAAAPQGEVGLWFIDPADIVISDEATDGIDDEDIPDFWKPEAGVSEATVNVGAIVDALNAGTEVEISTTNDSDEGEGTITVASAVAKTGDNDAMLTLNADRDIVVNQAISAADAGMLNVELNAEGEIRLNADVTTNNGAFTSNSVDFNNTGGDIIAGSGAVTINIGIGGISSTSTAGVATLGTITTTGAIAVNGSGTGADTLVANGDWVLTGLSSAGAAEGRVGGSVNFADIEVLSGTNATLTGPDLAVNWDIDGSDNTLALEGGTAAVFSGMDNLVGGAEADTFTVRGGSLSSISGGGSNDIFTFSTGSNVSTVSGDAGGDTFNLNGGTVDTVNGDDGTDIFNINTGGNANQLNGDADADTFNIAGGSFTALDGGAGIDDFRIGNIASIDGETLTGDGTDTLSGPGENATWTVNAAQGGELATDNGTVLFTGMNTVVGGDQVDMFNISATIGTLSGGGGNDIFTFSTGSSVTTASGDAGGDTFNLNGGTVATANGGDGVDVFNIDTGGNANQLNGDAGADTFNIAGGSFTALDGGAGIDDFRIGDIASIDGETLTGDGTDTLSGPGENATWTVNAAQGGELATDNGTVLFTGMNTLVGGDQVDTFNISAAMGSLEGGAGNDLFNIAGGSIASLVGGTGEDTFVVSDLAAVDGGSLTGDGEDILSGPNADVEWVVDAERAGTLSDGVNSATFTGMNRLVGGNLTDTFTIGDLIETLEGGDGADRFDFNSGSSISTASGNGGADIFNFATGSDVDTADGGADGDTFNISGGQIASLIGGAGADSFNVNNLSVVNGDTLAGDDTDTLRGPNAEASWEVNGDRAGTLSDGVNNVTFTGMNRLIGGNQTDTFTIDALIETLEGGDGADRFDFNSSSSVTTASGGGGVDIFNFATGSDVDTADGGADGDTFNISGGQIASLIGGAGADSFNVNNLSVVNGDTLAGDDTDTLRGPNAEASWEVNGDRAGTLSDGVNSVTFTGMNRLIGGNQTDTFTIDALIETLEGGDGADRFDFNAGSNVDSVDGGADGDTFNISGGVIASISGGSGVDNFNVNNLSAVNGGTLTGDSVDVIRGPDAEASWEVNSDRAGTLSDDVISVTFTGMNRLIGGNQTDTFTIGALIEILEGGDGADSFDFNSGSNVDSVDGGAGGDTFNIVGGVIASIRGGSGVDNFNVNNLSAVNGGILIGDDIDVIQGPNAEASWEVNSDRAGTLSDDVNSATFTGMNHLIGGNQVDTFTISALIETLESGAGADIFNFEAGGNITTADGGADGDTFNISGGQIASLIGGSGADSFNVNNLSVVNGDTLAGDDTDTLRGPNAEASWEVNGDRAGTLSDGVNSVTFTGMNRLIGGNLTDTFTIDALIETLEGGDGADRFDFNSSSSVTTASGGGGVDIFNFTTGSNVDSVDGGAGEDTFNISGGVIASISGGSGVDNFNVNNLSAVNGGTLTGDNVDVIWGPNAEVSWEVNSDRAGTLSDDVNSVTFTGMNRLVGGNQTDTFTIGALIEALEGGDGADSFDFNSGSSVTTVSGDGGADIFDFAAGSEVDTADGGADRDTFNISGGQIASIIGGADIDNFNVNTISAVDGGTLVGDNVDVLRGPNEEASWEVNGDRAGTLSDGVNSVTFTDMNRLVGGNQTDTFTIGALIETLEGGDGVDRFDFNSDSGVTTASGDGGSDIFNFATGSDVDTADGGADGDTFNISGGQIASLIGGAGADSFNVNNLSVVNGNTLVGDDTDTLRGPNAEVSWEVNGDRAGTLSDDVNSVTFTGMSRLIGGNQTDSFTIGALIETLEGGDGADSFDFNAGSSVTTANGDGGEDIFNFAAGSDVDTADGGAGSDTFNISGGQIASLIGGAGADSFNVNNLSVVDGDTLVGDNTDTLRGPNTEVSWEVNGDRAGTLSDDVNSVTFTGMSRLIGGNQTDSFTISALIETLEGGDGADSFDFNTGSSVTTANGDGGEDIFNFAAGSDVDTADGGADGDTFNIFGGQIASLIGGAGADSFNVNNLSVVNGGTLTGDDTDILRGPNAEVSWEVNGDRAGTLSDDVNSVTFTGMNHLIGGNQVDTFTISALIETLESGAGADIFNFEAGSDVDTADGGANGDTFNISGGQITSLIGGAGADSFNVNNLSVVNGDTLAGDDTDTLRGPNAEAFWVVNDDRAGTLSTADGSVSFTGMNRLIGGNQVDTFTIGALIETLAGADGGDIFNFNTGSNVITADGGRDRDTFNLNGGLFTALEGGAGADNFRINNITSVSSKTLAGDGSDILSGPNTSITWTVNAIQGGQLTDGGSIVSFIGMDTLVGGSQVDTFFIKNRIATVRGGAGGDVFNFENNSDVTVVLGEVGGDTFNIFGGSVESIVGGADVDNFYVNNLSAVDGNTLTGDNTDILNGPDADAVWTISAPRTGQLASASGDNAVSFTGMNTLVGGVGIDTFIIRDVIATLMGGGGADIFNFESGSNVTSAQGGLGGDTFTFTGGSVALMDGGADADIFNIDGGIAGSLIGGAGNDVFNLTAGSISLDIEGGDNDDTFVLGNTGITGTLIGGSGSDTLRSLRTSSADWVINSASDGSLAEVSFSTVENLHGGSGRDTFHLNGGNLSTIAGGEGDDNFIFAGATATVAGEGGADTVTSVNGATWELTGNGIGTVDGNGFSGIETLQGGNGIDIFTFSGGQMSNVRGGAGADSFIFTAGVLGRVDGEAGADSFQLGGATVTSLEGGADADSLTGTSANTSWEISGVNSGTAGGISFTSVESLQGGSGVDTFTLSSGSIANVRGGGGDDSFTVVAATVSGAILGQTGTDTLNAPGDWALADVDSATGLTGQVNGRAFDSVERLQGDGLGNTTLIGSNENLNWNLTGTGSGTLSTTEQNATAFVFTGMGHLQGGSAVDNFVLTSGSIGSVRGGGGADTFRLGAATFTNLDGQTGSDTLYGTAQGLTWVIDSDQGNTVFGGTFADMELIQGGAGADTFNLVSGDTVTQVRGGDGDDHFSLGSARVSMDGESGLNTLTGPNADTLWTLTGDGTGTVANAFINNTFANMAILQGGAGADNFQLNVGRFDSVKGGAGSDRFAIGGATITGLLDGEEGMDAVHGTDANTDWIVENSGGSVDNIRFAHVETLQGGSGVDNVQLNASGGVVDVYGGAGNDVYVFGAAVSDVLLDGQEGADSIDGAGDWLLTNVDDNNGADGSIANNTFAHMETLEGDSAAGTTLKGADQTLVWTLASAGTGTLITPAAGATPINFRGMFNFSGGSGSDTLISTGASRNWTITTTGSSLGENGIGGFENLEDRTGAVTLTTDYSATFESGSNMQVGGSTLAYFGSPVTVTGADGVNGEVTTSTLTLIDITNDIELTGNVDSINANILGSGNISIDDSDDIRVNSLITGGGDIEVIAVNDIIVNHISTSGATGSTAMVTSTRGSVLARPRPLSPTPSGIVPDVHIEADNVNLNALVGNVGTPISPFVITAGNNVTVRGFTFVNPVFTPNEPANFQASGTRLISVAETLSTSAVRSAVQSRIEDFAVLDPAIFTALTPYNIEEGALTLPEDQRLEE